MNAHQPGDLIAERYRIINVLGQGGAGITYAAERISDGARVALKQLVLRHLTDWKGLELFQREARVLSQLDHPSIPRYVDYLETDGEAGPCFYLVQELAPGRSLASRVEGGWHPSEAEVRGVAEQLLVVLEYLHSLHPPVIHRDLKPQNILRRDDGAIYLVDFGAVQDTYRSMTGGTTVVGTYGYMAPEQFRAHAVPVTDLYGLGATLIFLLTGSSPSELPQRKLKVDFHSRVKVAPMFAAWLDRMLEPAPEDRFASASEALTALRTGHVPQRRSSGWRVALLASTLVLVAGGGLLALSYMKETPTAAAPSAAATPEANKPIAIAKVAPVLRLAGQWSAVFSVAFAPDGGAVASGSNDRTIKLWSLSTGEVIRSFPGHSGRVASVAITRDGKTLVSGGDRTVKIWDLDAGALLRTLAGHSAEVSSVAVDSAGRFVASGGFDGAVALWDLATGAKVRTMAHGDRVLTVAFSPDGNTLASGGYDKAVKLWRVDDGAALFTLAHAGPVNKVVFAPDGQTLIAADDAKAVKVWHAGTGQQMRELAGHTSEVWAVDVDPTGRTVVTGGKDGLLRIFDVYTGALKRSFAADSRGVIAVAISADGGLIASGGGSQTVNIWPSSDKAPTAPSRDVDVEDRPGWDALHVAAWDGDLAAVKSLLDKGTPVDVRNARRRTPLYNAAKRGHRKVAEYLIERGADVNAADVQHLVPAFPAVQNGHLEMVEFLLSKGADPHAKTDSGQSFLYKAAEQGHVPIVKLLLAKGLDINAADRIGWTPLGIACRAGNTGVVEVLLAQPSLDLKKHVGSLGNSPLMLAAAYGHDDVVRLLLDKGVDVNEARAEWTALKMAEKGGYSSTAKLLRERGAR